MYEVIFLWVLALVYIAFAVIQDIKTHEIADWLNFSLIVFALGFRLFYSLFQGEFSFFYNGLIGLVVFFLVGNLFYYGKIFAGGDAKLMIALGAVIPLQISFIENIQNFMSFIFIFLVIGFCYIIISSLFLMIRNFKDFKKEFLKQFHKNKKLLIIMTVISIVFLMLGFLESILFVFGLLILFSIYLYLYSKSIDEVCMVKTVLSKDLTEGDWLYKSLKIGKYTIKANWDGLTKEDIKKIIKKYKKVTIKRGVPFSPTFLISFILFIIINFLKIDLWNSFWKP